MNEKNNNLILVYDPEDVPEGLTDEEQIEFWETHEVTEEYLAKVEEVSEDERPRPRGTFVDVPLDDITLDRFKVRISYHEDTDSLYIHLSNVPTEESEEVAPDTVLHFDEDGNVTGIEIYSEASKRVDLSKVKIVGLEGEQVPTVRAMIEHLSGTTWEAPGLGTSATSSTDRAKNSARRATRRDKVLSRGIV